MFTELLDIDIQVKLANLEQVIPVGINRFKPCVYQLANDIILYVRSWIL